MSKNMSKSMKTKLRAISIGLCALALGVLITAQGAASVFIDTAMVQGFPIQSDLGATNQVQYRINLSETNWVVLTNLVVTQSPFWFVDMDAPPSPRRFYRVLVLGTNSPVPPGMALIPAGPFTMGNCMGPGEGDSDELPLRTVYVSAFCMEQHEVTKALWWGVYNWAKAHGYSFDTQWGPEAKGTNHPVYFMTWNEAVMWCNARSEQEGRTPAYYTSAAQTTVYRGPRTSIENSYVKWSSGYRLPTEAEWEKAARGGLSGKRFPWGDTISESQANYYGDTNYSYDLGPNGYNAAFTNGAMAYTSPVGSFAANGYGLYDMVGNVDEYCWDVLENYSSGSQTDPRGPESGFYRVTRGGSWGGYGDGYSAYFCRVAARGSAVPGDVYYGTGFRCVLPPSQ